MKYPIIYCQNNATALPEEEGAVGLWGDEKFHSISFYLSLIAVHIMQAEERLHSQG
ncbi:hypothetical protein ACSYAD_03000 [Acaryochloris marina NIES-2412]|uniref:hypothetical protein n=1 Tax=Acaryochloris marina TaxID=155978 RepID=UPI004057FC63